mmetsp:Transcript_19077/g.24739  ORF Transcript_19077/g.24739 Transcript_19077/m.24739 type:complete len:380 (+) Transcript_19077:406-1545(+)
MSGRITIGNTGATLCGYRLEAPTVATAFTKNLPAFQGDMKTFVQMYPRAGKQCINQIKKCSTCKKVCAITMTHCNGCGTILSEEISQSFNVFMGFIFGIEKANFPLKFSLRLETDQVFVFDDPLALTPAHVCAVPRNFYIPSALTLFQHPKKGLTIIQQLENEAWRAIEMNFLQSPAWKTQFLQQDTANLRDFIISGVNIPPSQYQLHIQFMLPPLLPQHFSLFQRDLHFNTGRFVPTTYLLDALSALETTPLFVSTLNELTSKVQELTGLNYQQYSQDYKLRVHNAQLKLAKWHLDDFDFMLLDDSDISTFETRLLSTNKERISLLNNFPDNETVLFKEDTRRMQQYGRPFDEHGQPTGCYLNLTSSSFSLGSPLEEF